MTDLLTRNSQQDPLLEYNYLENFVTNFITYKNSLKNDIIIDTAIEHIQAMRYINKILKKKTK